MVINASGKSTGGVTNTAIFGGRHVVWRLIRIGVASRPCAIIHDAGVIDECAGKTLGIMAHRAIGRGFNMTWRLTDSVNAVIPRMAIPTRLRYGVDDGMVENATETEVLDVMAYTTIDSHFRMTVRLTGCNAAIVTGIASFTHNVGAAVVDKGIRKACCGMTETALRSGIRVVHGGLACSQHSVVARAAATGNIGVIKAAVRLQFQKRGGIVTFVAFGRGFQMQVGFADGYDPVMALAAITEHFLMIDNGENGKSKSGMTGLTHITGGKMVR